MNRTLPIFIACSFLTACGSGDSSNSADPENNLVSGGGNITVEPPTENTVGTEVEQISFAATETVKRTISQQNSPISFGGGFGAQSYAGDGKTVKVFGSELSATATESSSDVQVGDCGGQIVSTSTNTTSDNPNQFYPFGISYSADYQSYCTGGDGGSVVFDGKFLYDYQLTSQDEYYYIYDYDLTYTSTLSYYPSGVISAYSSCTKKPGEEEVCTSSSNYESDYGTYSLSNTSLTGDSSSGYSVTGTISDDNNNSYDISVSGFTQCTDGNVQTGTFEIVGSDGKVISITFPNCNECIITYEGVSETFPQD